MIGIVVAMQIEADCLLKNATIHRQETISGKKIYEGQYAGKDFVLALCGVGKVNASFATALLIQRYPIQIILNFGVAGGLNSSTKVGEVYEIESAVQFDFDLTQLNGTKMGTLDEYSENYLPLNPLNLPSIPLRKLGTSDRFNDSHEDFLLLTKELCADIRDMEGGAIVQSALCAGLPVRSFKAISDLAGSGSTTDQYLQNRANAIRNFEEKLPLIFERL